MTQMTPSPGTSRPDLKEKKKYVRHMFNGIAGTYDLLNHLLSFGIDHYWRWRAIRLLKPIRPELLLDMATGTGDFAIAASRQLNCRIIGLDLSEQMLAVGHQKLVRKALTEKIQFACADAENIPAAEDTFDAATVAFGVRNFETLTRGLREFCRVLKPGGHLVILEFSKPRLFPFKQLYFFYFRSVLPLVGRLVSKDPEAYTYLPDSVSRFPEPESLAEIIRNAGFSSVDYRPLTFGIVHIHHAVK